MTWIGFTLFAAFMQAIRTAAQKSLSAHISALGVTYVRYLFGLPFVVIYLTWLSVDFTAVGAATNTVWLWILVGGVAQIMATWALVSVFRWHNFAVGTTFAKTEALLAALLGTLFFGLTLTMGAWVSVLIGVSGMLVLTWPKEARQLRAWLSPATLLGMMSGLCFAINALLIHYSTRQFALPPIHAAAVVLCSMIVMQIAVMSVWMMAREPSVFRRIALHWRPGLFVGLTSALGSIGWYSAMSLQNPALVKTLGLVEFIFVLVITWRVFRERISAREWLGMALILLGVAVVMRLG
ncbi:MAG: DMT family transporter [Natronospirillum sp.]